MNLASGPVNHTSQQIVTKQLRATFFCEGNSTAQLHRNDEMTEQIEEGNQEDKTKETTEDNTREMKEETTAETTKS